MAGRAAVAGLTLWAVLLLGVAVTAGGALGRVPLAVITLTALAAFEAVTALPAVAIALRGARVAYRPGGPLALGGIDLDLPPGRRVALLGPTGSGKSTVAAVLLRFVSLTGGTATLNGRDLAGLRGDDVRRAVRGLAQDAQIFNTTIRANLLIGAPEASDDQLARAAAQARLLDWITGLPESWETPVGPHGGRLSGGQRQRLALARALLADPPVLVLDEPTAHLDPDHRRDLAADLLAVSHGRSTLLITHDLLGLDQVDEIVVLSGGLVTERGSHAELSGAGGPYQQILRANEWG